MSGLWIMSKNILTVSKSTPDEYTCKFIVGDIIQSPTLDHDRRAYYLILDMLGSHYQVIDLSSEVKTEAFVGTMDSRAKKVTKFSAVEIQALLNPDGSMDGPKVVAFLEMKYG